MSQYKIIFTGPVGAGKTTAIAALSDIAPVSTAAKATDMTRDRKEKTTVAMDYGAMRLEDGGTVHLYGTPGQERFDFALNFSRLRRFTRSPPKPSARARRAPACRCATRPIPTHSGRPKLGASIWRCRRGSNTGPRNGR